MSACDETIVTFVNYILEKICLKVSQSVTFEEFSEMVFLTSALCARVAKHTNEFFGKAQVIFILYNVLIFSFQYIHFLYF